MLNMFSGLLQGYVNEKDQLNESVQSLEDKKELLAGELERTRTRLECLEEVHADMEAREEDLQRQRQALEQSFGHEEQGIVLSLTPCIASFVMCMR